MAYNDMDSTKHVRESNKFLGWQVIFNWDGTGMAMAIWSDRNHLDSTGGLRG